MAARRRDRTSRSELLRGLLSSDGPEFLLEAHNGISAVIAEEAGFKGIWASGLALSAQFGVRDNNETSWTQVVDMIEFMTDATSIPILLDGDTGYGNFNNARRLVQKLEQRGVAGVCIEDKPFPKSNSFIDGSRQQLADVREFCSKITAAKDAQTDDAFCVIARVEAYIAGRDTAEALRRAEAYRLAGADGILIHSALSRPDQILEFAREWAGRSPLVIVPTKYYSTPTSVFREAGIDVVIWANHLIRSAVEAMQETADKIFQDQSLVAVEDRIASLGEIFRLQGIEELTAAERLYGGAESKGSAIVLAASRGDDLEHITSDRPKAMLPVNGKPLLSRLVDLCKRHGVDDVTVVGGYKSESIAIDGITVVPNTRHATTGELSSLACALDSFQDDMVVLYGDLLFRRYIFRELMEEDKGLVVVVDSWSDSQATSASHDFVRCSAPDDRSLWWREVELQRVMRTDDSGDETHGRWIGVLRAAAEGRRWIEEAIAALGARDDFDTLRLGDMLNHIIDAGHTVHVMYVRGDWVDINSLADLEEAGRFTAT